MRIGVFDSGLGGLTVLRELLQEFPDFAFFYFGDTAHLPYGSKSPETIQRLSRSAAAFLTRFDIDVFVIACHTASSWAAQAVRQDLSIPVLDMITPTLEVLRESLLTGPIGILGTRAMLASGVYQRALHEQTSRPLVAQPCPLFVPLIEEGLLEDAAVPAILQSQLRPLVTNEVTTVILGCTHYPIILPLLEPALPSCQEWIDPARAVARALRRLVTTGDGLREAAAARSLSAGDRSRGLVGCWVSDDPAHFMQMSCTFLGTPVRRIELAATDVLSLPRV